MAYVLLIIVWKFGKGSRTVDPSKVDLITGRITKDDRIRQEEMMKMAEDVGPDGIRKKLPILMRKFRLRT